MQPVVAEALGRHELAVAAHLDDATVGESHDGSGALMANPPPMHLTNKPTITTGLRGVPHGACDDASHPTRTTPAPQIAPS
jgi:hypothetical protein